MNIGPKKNRRRGSRLRRRRQQPHTKTTRWRAPRLEQLEPRLVLDGGGFTFVDSFSGPLGPHWEIPNLAGDGIVERTAAYSVDTGGQSLFFHSDAAVAGAELNEAILTVDLSEADRPILTFHQLEGDLVLGAGDSNNPLGDVHVVAAGSSARPLEALGDGLTISVDGLTWYKLRDVRFDPAATYSTVLAEQLAATINRGGDGLWQLHEYDLAGEVDRINSNYPGAGLTLDGELRIKFSQYGADAFPFGGWAIDKVQVTDQPQLFDPRLEPAVFHRLSLPGEDYRDFHYRMGMFGTIDANTPILVSVHGADRNIPGYTHSWEKLFADPASSATDVIVVAPYFTIGGDYDAYNRLAWGDNADGRTADGVLLQLLDEITATLTAELGGSHDHPLAIYGHSGGGQFTERFLLAHPDVFQAAVVSSPGFRTFPDGGTPFPYGIGPGPLNPAPAGIDLEANLDAYLSSRIMFWVGDHDNAPDAWTNTSGLARVQGYGRLHRALNMVEAVHAAEQARLIHANDFEYELVVAEGHGHGGKDQDDLISFYEFLFSPPDTRAPVQLHPVVVTTPSSDARRATLPPATDGVAPGSDFYLEIWVEAPGLSGVAGGSLDVFYDTNLIDALPADLAHGMFSLDTGGVVDEAAGRVRDLHGRSDLTDLGVDEYALFGRVHFEVDGTLDPTPTQIAMALQHNGLAFELASGVERPSRLRPVARVDIGVATSVRGAVFEDLDGDAVRDGNELGLSGWDVTLRKRFDSTFWVPASAFYNIFTSGYEPETVISHVSTGMTLSVVGDWARAEPVAVVAPNAARPDDLRAAWWNAVTSGPRWNPLWTDGHAELRIDFAAPAEYFAIFAYGAEESGHARIEAYNAAGVQVAELISSTLFSGYSEVLELDRPAGDIAYVLVSSDTGSPGVYLANPACQSRTTTQTDGDGNYEFSDLSGLFGLGRDAFRVTVTPRIGWDAAWPRTGEQYVALDDDVTLEAVDFAVVPETHAVLPDLVGTSLEVPDRNLWLNDGTTTVQFSIRNQTFVSSGPFDVRFYLSEDPIIDPSDPDDVLVPLHTSAGGGDGYRVTTGLSGFAELAQTIQLATPATDPFPGNTTNHYYLGIVVDGAAEVDEQDEANNSNAGLAIDQDDVTYAVPAAFPFTEDWESGTFADHWEVIPGGTVGRIEVTSDHEPYAGDRHVVLDHNQFWGTESDNQLVLHVDLAAEHEVLLGLANREWNDLDDFRDRIDFGLNDLEDTARIAQLTGANSTNTYAYRWFTAGCGACHFVEDTLIRFQQHGERMVPHQGMALDDIVLLPALADLTATALSTTWPNLETTGGFARVNFTYANLTPQTTEPFNIAFFLSQDRTIDPATDLPLEIFQNDPHYEDVPDHLAYRSTGLAGMSDVTDSVLLWVPADDPFGGGNHYYIGMVIDSEDEIEELDESDNSNRGTGLDVVDVRYTTPARPPLLEDWESGTFADCWEAIPGPDGILNISASDDPFSGTYHVLSEDRSATEPSSLNQLIWHLDLSLLNNLQLSWASREWSDDDDVGQDTISLSVDGGATWRNIAHLIHTVSTATYTWHTFDLDSLGLIYTANTQLRFQNLTNGPIPTDGMAFDEIRIGPDPTGPRVLGHTPLGRVFPGPQDLEFVFSEPMDPTSFDLADVEFAGPDGGDLSARLIDGVWTSPDTLRVHTATVSAPGLYALTLSPHLQDLAPFPNQMDQDRDGRQAESGDDAYTAYFAVVAPLHFANMESDPGWTLDPGSAPYQWERGRPEGGGSQVPGPSEAVSGNNVLGYNLHGNYANNMPPEYATTPAIDATGYEHVAVSFYQWLSVEGQAHDQAAIQVSTNGSDWTTIYQNPAETLFADHWTYRLMDISSLADGQPTVYVRWAMGPTSATAAYAGWYLDDVLISGVPVDPTRPDVDVSDNEGVADDHRINFGTLGVAGESRTYKVTIRNTGLSDDLLLHRIALDDTTNYALTWDGDGRPPGRLAAGASRTAQVTFAPISSGVHDATLQFVTNDPDAAEATLAVALTGRAYAPGRYGWTHSLGSKSFDAALAVVTDHLGNMFVGGFYEGTVDFDPDPIKTEWRTSLGSRDLFVSKFAADGTHIWTWTAGGEQSDEVHALALDSEGRLLIAGEYRLTADFDPNGLGGEHTALGLEDAFVTRLLADGTHDWTRTFGGTKGDAARGLGVDSLDRIYVYGDFSGTVDFNPLVQGEEHQSQGFSDVFVTGFEPNGEYLGTYTIGGVTVDLATDISIDPQDNIVLAGTFTGLVDFDPGPGVDLRSPIGMTDVFLVRFKSNHEYDWTWTIGGLEEVAVGDITHDMDGNLYVTGGYQGSVIFNGPHQSDMYTSQGDFDTYLMKLDSQGDYGWTRVMRGKATDFGNAIATDAHGELIVAGIFNGTLNCDPGGVNQTLTSAGKADMFLARFGADGAYRTSYQIGGTLDDYAAAVAATGDVPSAVVAGYFQGSVDFDPTSRADWHTSDSGSPDIFASRLLTYPEPRAEIHGRKWSDRNGNGIQDAGEPGLPGWTIFLDLDEDGNVGPNEPSTVTGSDGGYTFPDLLPGVYRVAEVGRNHWLPTEPPDGARVLIVEAVTTVVTAHFGGRGPTLGDLVWEDRNGDGVQTVGEPGVADVTVRLYGGSGGGTGEWALLQTTETDAEGRYRFDGGESGEYFIEFVPPTDYEFTLADWTDDDLRDSDAEESSGRTTIFTIAPLDSDLSWDAGLVRTGTVATVGDFVWEDKDGDGIQDPDEHGLVNVHVSLIQRTSTYERMIASTVTNTGGRYVFTDIEPGEYSLRFALPGGYALTVAKQGGNDTRDSDADPRTGATEWFTVAYGQRAVTWDAGVLVTDFGDAPTGYPTLLADDGARHGVLPRMYLGMGIEADADGQPTSRADGDDWGDASDDEDGIVFLSALVPDDVATIQVQVSAAGALDAWIDFNGNGSWADPEDQILGAVPVDVGTQELQFPVPGTATLGVTFARFRYSKAGGYSYTGAAPVGEVEDYAVVIEALDFGDAPDQPESSTGTPLVAPDPISNAFFGQEVVLSGDWAFVGAEASATGGLGAGAIYVYRQDRGGWIHHQTLIEPHGNNLEDFGDNLAVFGNWLVAGAIWAHGRDDVATGIVYVYRWSGTEWTLAQELVASDAAYRDYFGQSVAVWGEHLLVGAPQSRPQPGAVYAYQWNGAEWEEVQKLVPSDVVAHDFFGQSVALDDEWAVVGATGVDPSGAAYVYQWDGHQWVQDAKLMPSDLLDSSLFGSAVDISDSTVVVGAPWHAESGPRYGQAYVFQRTTRGWSEVQFLLPEHTFVQFFGTDVSVADGQLAVGSRDHAYLYRWNGTEWPLQLETDDGVSSFGVAVEGHRLLVGQQRSSPLGMVDAGQVELYEFAPDPSDYQTLWVNNGARHTLNPDVYLGEKVDIESNGLVDDFAEGDDRHHGDDEDGVLLSELFPGGSATADVTASTIGFLNAWIDFNRDGDWDDDGEQVFRELLLAPGLNSLAFLVPTWAVHDEKFPTLARFRFGTERELSYDGPAIDGEVEDYAVLIRSTAAEIRGRVFEDLDGDGQPDIPEVGMNGWLVELIERESGRVAGVQRSHSVDLNADGLFDAGEESGCYEFTDVPLGDYGIRTSEPLASDVLQAPRLTLQESDLDHLLATVEFPEPVLVGVEGGGEAWTQWFVPGVESNLGDVGMPAVPVYRQLVGIPAEIDPADVTIRMASAPLVAYELQANLYPFQPAGIDAPDEDEFPEPDPSYFANPPEFAKNTEAYTTNNEYPSPLIEFTPLGILRDLAVGIVEVAAGQYNPVQDLLTIFDSVEFEITFTGPKGELFTPGFLPESALSMYEHATPQYDSVVNSEAVYQHTYPDQVAQRDVAGEEYLILTAPEFLDAARQLQTWKATRGIVTNVIKVGVDTGFDTAAAIRELIRSRYATSRIRPSYVLLLGDAEFIPTFYTVTAASDTAATDTPYSLIVGGGDDWLPDLALGRIPVDTLEQATDVISKLIAYEKTPPENGAFYESAAVAALFQGFEPDSGRDQRAYVEESERARDTLLAAGLIVDRVYALSDDDPHDPYDTPTSYHDTTPLPFNLGPASDFAWDGDTQDIVAAWNEGRLLVTYRGHGWPDGWSEPHFTSADVLGSLDNGNLTPIIYSIDCMTGLFDNETMGSNLPSTIDGVFFAEALLRVADGGGVGIVAPTRNTNTWANSTFYRGLLDATWTTHVSQYGGGQSIRRLGDINNYAKNYTLANIGLSSDDPQSQTGRPAVDNLLLYELFGDPTLELWTADPNEVQMPNELAYQTLPIGLLVQYDLEDATVSAYQQTGNGMLVAIGRGVIRRGAAVLDFVNQPDSMQPLQFAVALPGAASVAVQGTEQLARPQSTVLPSDVTGLAAQTVFPAAVLVDVEAAEQQWTQLLVPGLESLAGTAGTPAIPVYRQLIALPLDVDLEQISLTLDQPPRIAQVLTNVHLYPFQRSPSDGDPQPPPLTEFDDPLFFQDLSAYATDAPFPADLVRLTPLGDLRGLNLAVVEVAAGQYNPVSRKLTLFEQVDWDIDFGGPQSSVTGGFLTERAVGVFENAEPLWNSMLNADAVRERIVPQEPFVPVCAGAEYLILTHPDFRAAADELAEWKNAKGIVTQVIEVGVGTRWDTKEEIQDIIESHYYDCAVPPSYVLLLGDSEFIPTWYVEYDTPYADMPQSLASGRWRSIGSYHFLGTPGEGVTLKRGYHPSGVTDEGTIADAVRFTNVATGEVIIVDNGDPGFSTVGTWSESPATNEFNGSALVSTTDYDLAVWRVDLPREGVYDVEVWYSAESSTGFWHEFDMRAWYYVVGGTLGSDLPYVQMGGIFGDVLPDLALGRMPVDTVGEAAAVVAKTIAYEKTPPLDLGFYQNATVVGLFQGFRADPPLGRAQRAFIEESEHTRNTLLDAGYSVERIYSFEDRAPGDGNDVPLRYYDGTLLPADLGGGSGFAWNGSGADVRDAFRDGRFLVTYRAHGNYSGWTDPTLRGPVGTAGLTPVVYSITCEAGIFDNETSGSLHSNPGIDPAMVSFGEAMLREPDIGAVALIGAMRPSPTWANGALLRGLIDATWPTNDPGYGRSDTLLRLGDILDYGKEYLLANVGGTFGDTVDVDNALENVYQYHLLGDPTLEMRIAVPNSLRLAATVNFQLFSDRREGEEPDPESGARAPAPAGMELQYAHDGATITARQEVDGKLIPLGRTVVRGGSAVMDFITTFDPDAPILLSASLPGETSVPLVRETVWQDRPAVPVSVDQTGQQQTVHTGAFRLGSVTGQVFEDRDGDGVHDPGELGLAPRTLELVNTDTGQVVASTTTANVDANHDGILDMATKAGRFAFYGIPPAKYTLRLVSEAGGRQTVPTNDAPYTLQLETSGQSLTGQDFGVQLLWDLGDAPATYTTWLADNGPRHTIVSGLYLGTTVDPEPDSWPHGFALGDDEIRAPNDEDGVVFLNPLVAGGVAAVAITATGTGYLSGWIDFNVDGDFADGGEHIFADEILDWGGQVLTFPVSALATAESGTFARFRFSSQPGLSFDGPAIDGEVEDYWVPIAVDTDLDGVADQVEAGAPNGGDGNTDGVADRLQNTVTSLPSQTDGTWLTLVTDIPTSLSAVYALDAPQGGEPPEGIVFALGQLAFTVTGVQPGGEVLVEVLVDQSLPLNTYYGFGPYPQLPAWYPFIYHGTSGAELLADRIRLHYVDGALGDTDLSADGVIVSARGGAAINQRPKPWQNPVDRLDVSNDQRITPRDALLIINMLSRYGVVDMQVPPIPPLVPPYYFDVNGDNRLAPIDALLIINRLASSGESEGEPAGLVFHSFVTAEPDRAPLPPLVDDPGLAASTLTMRPTNETPATEVGAAAQVTAVPDAMLPPQTPVVQPEHATRNPRKLRSRSTELENPLPGDSDLESILDTLAWDRARRTGHREAD